MPKEPKLEKVDDAVVRETIVTEQVNNINVEDIRRSLPNLIVQRDSLNEKIARAEKILAVADGK